MFRRIAGAGVILAIALTVGTKVAAHLAPGRVDVAFPIEIAQAR